MELWISRNADETEHDSQKITLEDHIKGMEDKLDAY